MKGERPDISGFVMIPATELQDLIERTVKKAISDADPARLVDKQALAQLFDCSPTHIDNLRRKGLPTVMVGNVVRFRAAEVLAWLKAQKGAA